ncbi:MAG: hypothetical protein Q8L55_04605 [Phycisphaerales bacterium]|nr:hypothetical protein [Phycisphaerales bacterium]
MPDNELLARLDAMGAHAAADTPPMPPAITWALAARRACRSQRAPLPALAAAAAVIAAGAALVVLKAPSVLPRDTAQVRGGREPLTPLSMMERYNRAGSLDAALNTPTGSAGSAMVEFPVVRAIDARSGQLPE